MRSALLALTCAAAVALFVLAGPSRSDAQDTVAVDGTADFRNPPRLAPGSYSDTIVTGETVWYAVLYTNDVPYRFAADLTDIDLDAQSDLTLSVSFVGPTLSVLDSGLELQGSARYDGGGTNVWYLAVSLDTEGRLGVEHQLVLDVEGVLSAGLEPCEADCALREQLAAVDADIVEVQERIDGLGEDPTAVLEAELTELETRRNTAEDSLDRADARIRELCAPEPDCEELTEPPSTTPLWATALGGLLLAAGVASLAVFALRR
ncbi:MAG: hypothetical protein OEV40_19640 [Acidimicrobiia bacterium]|nr:hypothetical protein [Acidimicrobiia bacterium]